MYTVKIGSNEKPLNEVTESWVVHQVHERRENNQSVCAQVILKDSSVDMILSTPACGGGGGGREPNHKEHEILRLWNVRHLNVQDWAVGELIAFLKQLSKLL